MERQNFKKIDRNVHKIMEKERQTVQNIRDKNRDKIRDKNRGIKSFDSVKNAKMIEAIINRSYFIDPSGGRVIYFGETEGDKMYYFDYKEFMEEERKMNLYFFRD